MLNTFGVDAMRVIEATKMESGMPQDDQIDVETGVARFVEWYCDYYGVQLSDWFVEVADH